MNEREHIEILQRFQDARVSLIEDSCHGRDTEGSRRQLATASVDLYATLVGKYAERKEAERLGELVGVVERITASGFEIGDDGVYYKNYDDLSVSELQQFCSELKLIMIDVEVGDSL